MSLKVYKELERGEVWRAIPGHEGYEVSDFGRVRSFRAHAGKRRLQVPRIRKVRVNQHGYVQVGLQVEGQQKQFLVHGLVAKAFLGPRPDGMQVAHGDGSRTNNRLENLRYATPVENAADKNLHGTVRRGEEDGNARLTGEQVAEIRRRHALGERQVDLADEFGVSQSQVSNITRRASWAHLDEKEAC